MIPAPPRLPAALPRSGVSADARVALRQLHGDYARALAIAFRAGAPAIELAHQRAQCIERIIAHCWTAFLGETDKAALFAVGGFGRGALFPHSDVDLLALADDVDAPGLARALEAFFGCLWDVGLRPGHAVRTPRQCRDIAANDVSVFTSLLDARRVAGAATFDAALRGIVGDPDIWPPDAYLAAKRADRDARHARHDDTTHNLEPNLKDGPGGLRSLDLIRWLGWRVTGARDFDGLVSQGLLDDGERTALRRCRARVATLPLRAASGSRARGGPSAVRLAARARGRKRVTRTTRAIWQSSSSCRISIVPRARRSDCCRNCSNASRRPCVRCHRHSRWTIVSSRAAPVWRCATRRLSTREPARHRAGFRVPAGPCCIAGVRCRDHARLAAGVAPARRRVVGRQQRAGIVPCVAAARRAGGARAGAMNRHGVLAAILPAFARVVGRMQYDLFHVYTVDEHTLRVLRNIARFADAARARNSPLRLRSVRAAGKTGTAVARRAVPRYRQGPRRRSFRAGRGGGARVLRAARPCRRRHRRWSRGWCAGIC